MNVFEQIKFPLDVWYLILEKLDFLSQIRLKQVCKYFYRHLEIHDSYDITDRFRSPLSDEILINYYFVRSLNAYTNYKITKVNHLNL
jgi:F-box domain